MRRITFGALALLSLLAHGAAADTFTPRAFPGAEEHVLLDRGLSRAELGRDLLGGTDAGLVIGRVDVYDRFPYLEARYLQVLSDPAWGRLLYGDPAAGLAAFDGAGSAFGALSDPRGLAADDAGRVYLADSGNDRVLVFQSRYDSETMALEPLYAIEGLKRPRDIAWSDAGTPFDEADDRLYVANTGANELRSFRVEAERFTADDALGALGGGEGRFGGPVAVAATWDAAAGAHRIVVADAHGSRLVELRDDGGLNWRRALPHDLGAVNGLAFDGWGNLYAVAAGANRLRKFSPGLAPVAELATGLSGPRDFDVPRVTVRDHRDGSRSRRAEAAGLVVETWGEGSGLRLFALGADVADLRPAGGSQPGASLLLTDRAALAATIVDPRDGATIARRELGTVDAGAREIRFEPEHFLRDHAAGVYTLRVEAASAYPGGATVARSAQIELPGGQAAAAPFALLGNHPNPFNPITTIRFRVQGPAPVKLEILDVQGRRVRVLAAGTLANGEHERVWDGRDESGRGVGSGMYFSRLVQGDNRQQGKLLLLK